MSDTPRPVGAVTLVLLVCFTMNMLSRGIGETYAVFVLPLGEALHVGRGALTGSYSLYMVVQGLCAPLAGLLVTRLGLRGAYLLGLTCVGVGYGAAAFVSALWQFYLCIGLIGAFGVACIGMVPASALLRRWFSARLTTAAGISYAGLGAGVLVLAPLTQLLIDQHGWRGAYLVLAGIPIVLLPVLALLPWRRLADGAPRAALGDTAGGAPATLAFAAALRTRPVWALFFIFFFTSMSVFTLSPQTVAYLVHIGYAPLQAATVFGTAALLAVGGMVLVAWSTERFGRLRIVTASYLGTLAGIGALYAMGVHPSPLLLVGYVALFGITAGSRAPIITDLASRLYPGPSFAAVFGTLNAGMGIGAGVGSFLGGLAFDATQAYTALFVLSAAAACCGLALFWLTPELRTGSWQAR